MKKTLIISGHPDIQQSTVNKHWLEKIREYPERFTVHELSREYPNSNIDVAREQTLVDAHDNVVFQFPVYWFNCPPLLKQWFDEVLTYGWAYGSTGKALANKKIGLAVSLGAPAADYQKDGAVGYELDAVLRPFELIANYINADYQPFFAFHTIDSNDGYDEAGIKLVKQSAEDYLVYLNKYFS
ncbi:MAG: NAD(P)H-dependent oxidoreductase [Neisseria sp.]|uniref:NAD(P)H-dependent oxidoreductase n=1 Tax=Neisseria sp. TaxID=192066 RepID=UPI0026DB7D7F|nr:NAD(P)H-dependent oxidoreductase [Neisseria sp.]MDO4641251.1 NAD(P)H-dependent oxidoreductase [Neisseria sp.]